jgi:hypothetical protein
MMGPGSKKMGGAGLKPGAPPTPMAGKPSGVPPSGMGMGMGKPGPMPPAPGGIPPEPPKGGIGGSGGFNKGGPAAVGAGESKPVMGHAKGGSVGGFGGGDTKPRHKGGRDHT